MIYRQGDVLLVRVESAEGGAEVPRGPRGVVLAEGEATGHAHVVADPAAKLIESVNGNRYLLAARPAEVVHEEHGTIALDPGAYRVILQREWSDAEEPLPAWD